MYMHPLYPYITNLHGALGLVVGVVGDVGRGVEQLPDAVTAVGGHH